MCTNFKVLSFMDNNNDVVIGRTMENCASIQLKNVSLETGGDLFFRSNNHHYKQEFIGLFKDLPINEEDIGLVWNGKYAFVGMNTYGQKAAHEGINTEGLYVGILSLETAEYQKVTESSKGLSYYYFPTWALSQFSSCDELIRSLNNEEVQICNPFFEDSFFKKHFVAHDKNGCSIVIEVTNENINIYKNNDYGVLTNDPIFPWHITNLQNYTNLTPFDSKNLIKGNFAKNVEASFYGNNFNSIPGSLSSPARFIRTAIMSNYAEGLGEKNAKENIASHILNTIDIPNGILRVENPELDDNYINDYTLWKSISNLNQLTYTVSLYNSPIPYSVDLKDLSEKDFEKLNGELIAIPKNEFSINLTNKLSLLKGKV